MAEERQIWNQWYCPKSSLHPFAPFPSSPPCNPLTSNAGSKFTAWPTSPPPTSTIQIPSIIRTPVSTRILCHPGCFSVSRHPLTSILVLPDIPPSAVFPPAPFTACHACVGLLPVHRTHPGLSGLDVAPTVSLYSLCSVGYAPVQHTVLFIVGSFFPQSSQ